MTTPTTPHGTSLPASPTMPPPAVAGRRADPRWIALVCGAASYVDAASTVAIGIVAVILQAALGLTPAQIGLLTGGFTFCVALGALFGGRLGDAFGRRRVFIATMLVLFAGAVLLVVSSSFALLLAGALLLGLGAGADLPVSIATIAEAADDSNRGKLVGFSQVLWFVGLLAGILSAMFAGNLGRLGAQIIVGHIAVITLVILLARLSIPESASWLEARAERAAGVHTIRADRANPVSLLSPTYRKPFLALIVFYTLVNVCMNTFGQFSTLMLVQFGGLDVAAASGIGVVTLPVGVLTALWFMRISDGTRRFRYFRVGAVVFVCCPLVPALFGFSVPTYVIASLLNLIGGGFAGEAIMKFWSQESFPTLMRTTAQGAVIAIGRIGAAALATVTPALLVAYGPRPIFAGLTVLAAAGLATAYVVFRTHDTHNEFDIEARTVSTAVTSQERLS